MAHNESRPVLISFHLNKRAFFLKKKKKTDFLVNQLQSLTNTV